MKILAVDASTRVASAALSDGEAVLGEVTNNTALTHSTQLMPMIDGLLRMTETAVSEIDVYAAAVGPGSFTGLRIGLATVKGLAAVGGKPVACVSTLEGMANQLLCCARLVCPMLDARNRHVYAAAYDTSGGQALEAEGISSYNIEDFLQAVKRRGRQPVFLGDAARLYRAEIDAVFGAEAAVAPPGLCGQRASALLPSAMRLIREGSLTHYADVVPAYYRKSQPEREREK